ncbi:short-chain dehydrogenase [Reticulibacter mediterranei]|uniref:Short-chain dehydrogenase n=1 Tax=Reticulibacter mediterranei TaxID=2778369 RepID=A0A8J3IPQ0_9CHLR|nr:SDR family oxidoreductase [Reticulibacter mediterranei]GHO97893.1 short-chain dehydrogenase [Reticulibacter mediterranei]
MYSLRGKVAVVTGGNSGIGLAVARAFHTHGASVVIAGRNSETLEKAAQELGENVLAVPSDITNVHDVERLMGRAYATFGKLDILFVNAGILSNASIEETDEATFDAIMGTNFKGAYFTIQKALPFFNDNGSIILNGSVGAFLSIPNSSVYSASKAAIHSLARSLSPELIDRGIRINTITIGPTATPIIGRSGLSPEVVEQQHQTLAAKLPIKRLGRSEEIANVALFLASDASSFVLGSEIAADGGALLNTL